MVEYVFLWSNTSKSKPKTSIFGRTDLRKGVSEAKFDVEAAGDVKNSKISRKSRKTRNFFKKKFPRSKNRKLQIVRNAFSRSFVPIGAKFEGRTDVRSSNFYGRIRFLWSIRCYSKSTLLGHQVSLLGSSPSTSLKLSLIHI